MQKTFPKMNQEKPPKPKRLSFFIVEPTVLLYAMAYGIFFGAYTAAFYRKVCHQKFQFNSSVNCQVLRRTKHAELEVQRFTVISNIVINVATFFPSMALSFFLDSNSERWGRKSMFLIGIVFSSFRFISYVWQFTYLEHSVFWLVLPLLVGGAGSTALTTAQINAALYFARIIVLITVGGSMSGCIYSYWFVFVSFGSAIEKKDGEGEWV